MALYVLAGTNGCGKSSIAGAMFRASGVDYFNPDEAAAAIRAANPGVSVHDANSAAWHEGKRLLERAIDEDGDFAFETTLGGTTITSLLAGAMQRGREVYVWYAGLASVELHLERVRRRVARGGHDIPEAEIRKRYDTSRLNLIALMPGLAGLRVYDNSAEADPATGEAPEPVLLLHVERGKLVAQAPLDEIPAWAKPILQVALSAASELSALPDRRR